MKKIGILFGQENTFPWAFIERVNEKKIKGVTAEAVSIDKVMQGEATEYAVIIDRISQDVPFYRAYLKNAAISGAAVINNPFWWSADEKFFNNALAVKIGVPVPNTVILPSKAMPNDTNANSFRNLKYPLDWEAIFKYVGFPAYMKPYDGGGWKSVYKVENMEDFFDKYAETGQLVMMLQSEVVFDQYYRCYCLGGKHVHIMPYEPRNPHHLRYTASWEESPEILAKIHEYVLKLCRGLGYDFNTVEFGVSNGVPYAIDFCNPAPDADVHSVGQENFDWIVENAANFAIEKALAHKEGKDNLTWGTFMKYAVNGANMIPSVSDVKYSAPKFEKAAAAPKAEKVAAPKAAAKPKAEKKAAAPKAEKMQKVAVPKAPAKPKAEKKAAAPKAEKAKKVVVPKAPAKPKAEKKVAAPKIEKVQKVVVPKAPAKSKAEKKAAAPKAEKVQKVAVPKAPAKPKAEKKAAAPKAEKVAAAPKAVASTKDDLKRIEGIGPKIEELLNAANILTFKDLATTKADKVKTILEGGGKRFQMHDPTSWASQSQLAATGKWDELKKLQDELNGGKKK
jgi:predicted flap endonuclease-1-like 5' DNA nuclease